ncbi:MAG: TRAP transporter TatT component family protein [Nitrospira sp.]|nr:TRAP transporter TatT component family protein [Nitrospira sp.]
MSRLMAETVGEALSGASDVYMSEADPDLVQEALPFGLKTLESLLTISPDHRGLLLSAAKGFTTYAYLLQDEADRTESLDRERARHLRARSKGLYLRGRDYAFKGLTVKHPGFATLLRDNPASALALVGKDEVPLLYWAGAAWGGALSSAPEDLALVAEARLCGALMDRVIELDERYESGAAHEFLIAYEAARPGGSDAEAREHFYRTLALMDAPRASLFVTVAERLSVKQQNADEFTMLLTKALAVDPQRRPNERLINVVAQRRARWLLSRVPELFLDVWDVGSNEEAKEGNR